MAALELDDADGYLDVALAGREPVRLDLYVAHDTFGAAVRSLPEEPTSAEWFAALKTAAAELGFGAMSGYAAQTLRAAVADRVAEVKKKEPPTPA